MTISINFSLLIERNRRRHHKRQGWWARLRSLVVRPWLTSKSTSTLDLTEGIVTLPNSIWLPPPYYPVETLSDFLLDECPTVPPYRSGGVSIADSIHQPRQVEAADGMEVEQTALDVQNQCHIV